MAIKLKIGIDASPGVIFDAITTNDGYHGWWTASCDIDCSLGHRSSVRFEKEEATEAMVFETLEFIKNETLVWRCLENNVFPSWIGTTLSFEISSAPKQSILNFVQKSDDPNWKNHADYQSSKGGWGHFLTSLKDYCETGEGQPWEQE
jgi:uncharacterized protein YndB with AHSA1/START domain